MKSQRPFEIIVIAGSAGAFGVLRTILPNLSADLFPPVVIVQHLPQSIPSELVQLLNNRTTLPIKWAVDGEHLERGTIYVAPPGSQVTIGTARRLKVNASGRNRLGTPAADPLLKSVAQRFGSRAIAVILSGYLWDGAAGIQAMKSRKATILIQNPNSAEAQGMPRAAICTQGAHFVLPPVRIALALSALIRVPGVVPLLRDRHIALRHWLCYA